MEQGAEPHPTERPLREDGDAQSVDISLVSDPQQLLEIATIFKQIWSSSTPIVGIELLRAISHAGGYVAGVTEHLHGHDRLVGASVGFLGRHHGASSLHSHITGILAGVRSSGVGRAVKAHQRAWCAERGIDWITWTFDPLVRRNGWFNIEILGAEIDAYLIDFYGPMDDGINAGDQTDRLLAAWAVVEDAPREPPPESWATVLVDTPDNIVELRRTDPRAAQRWRERIRAELGGRLDAGARVTGFTRDGEYVVRIPPDAAGPDA